MDKILRAIAIDDEPVALEIFLHHAGAMSWLDVQETFVNASAAAAYLKQKQVDVVFLDIQMPDVNGIDFARQLTGPQFIFTTAFADYAATAFDLYATDFLLKPFTQERLQTACERALERKQKKQERQSDTSYLFVKSGYDLVRIDLDELLFVQSADNYLIFYMPGNQVVSRMTMTSLLLQAPAGRMIRTHQSYAVPPARVDRMEHDTIYIETHQIPVSSKYKKAIRDALRIL